MKTIKSNLFVLCIFSFMFFGLTSANAVTEEWVQRYDHGIGSDYSEGIALDPLGNIYITGSVVGDGWEWETIKYAPDGTQLWAKNWDGPITNGDDAAKAIAVDNSGNVYVTGHSWQGLTMRDIVTIAYDTAGNVIWGPVSYDGNLLDDEPWDITVNNTTGDVVTPQLWVEEGVL